MQAREDRPSGGGRRVVGIVCGFGVQAFFLATVWKLHAFLRDGAPPREDASLAADALLCLLFAAPHSLLLTAAARDFFTRGFSKEFYGSFYCAATCISLLTTFHFWQGSPVVLWNLAGAARLGALACFYLSWGALFYSISLTGMGFQTGWTPFWHWLRRLPPPKRKFEPKGAYLLLRHPVYLSFLGLIWFTPRMTLDHAVLTGVWTIYIFVGSHLKDERLAFYYRDAYRAYQERTAGYPWFPGPLGRRTARLDPPHARPSAPHAAPVGAARRAGRPQGGGA